MPGGFHPFHAGHANLYQQAKEKFPNADVYVAATNDQSERPFPFALKEKLAKLAGVEPGRFVQVKSPFQAKEILQNYNPEEDVVVFIRSKKDINNPPQPGGTKKDGSPAYFQPYTGKNMQPFGKHAYMDYLDTVKFGNGITSATEIRKEWPTLDDETKLKRVMSFYPATQKNSELAQKVVDMFDQVMGTEEPVNEYNLQVTESIRRLIAAIKPMLSEATFEQKQKFVSLLSEAKQRLAGTVLLENTNRLYSERQAEIVDDLGNGYFLGDDSYDDDDGFVKAGYSVYYQEGPDQYRLLGSVNMSPYSNPPGHIENEIKKLISSDQNLSESADYLEEK